MDIKKNIIPTCFYCNTELKIDLDGFMVVNIGGYASSKKEEKSGDKKTDESEELIETVSAKLCSCPRCGRKERIIGEDPEWLSMSKIEELVIQGKIISTNPEIELLFKVMAKIMKHK